MSTDKAEQGDLRIEAELALEKFAQIQLGRFSKCKTLIVLITF